MLFAVSNGRHDGFIKRFQDSRGPNGLMVRVSKDKIVRVLQEVYKVRVLQELYKGVSFTLVLTRSLQKEQTTLPLAAHSG